MRSTLEGVCLDYITALLILSVVGALLQVGMFCDAGVRVLFVHFGLPILAALF